MRIGGGSTKGKGEGKCGNVGEYEKDAVYKRVGRREANEKDDRDCEER